MREDSKADSGQYTHIISDVIPNRAESPVRNLLFSGDDLDDRAQREPPVKTVTDAAAHCRYKGQQVPHG